MRAAPARWAAGALVARARRGRAARASGVPGRSLRVPGRGLAARDRAPRRLPGRFACSTRAPRPAARRAQAAAASGGRVVALDVHRGGVRRIAAETARLGIANARAARGRRPARTAARHVRRGPGRRAVLGPRYAPPPSRAALAPPPEDDLPRLATLQGELLAGVAPLVRPGGALVYAVCTPMRAETDDVIASFLARAPALRPRIRRGAPACARRGAGVGGRRAAHVAAPPRPRRLLRGATARALTPSGEAPAPPLVRDRDADHRPIDPLRRLRPHRRRGRDGHRRGRRLDPRRRDGRSLRARRSPSVRW